MFDNISQILALDVFSIKENSNNFYKVNCEGVNKPHSQEFMIGICEGILNIRHLSGNSFELICNDDGSTIITFEAAEPQEVVT